MSTPEVRRMFSGIYRDLFTVGKRPASLLVSGAAGGEGATTVAVGIGVAAAESRLGQVLLIDGNWHNTGVRKFLDMTNGSGLDPAIVEKLPAGTVLRETEIPNLSVLELVSESVDNLELLEPPLFRNVLEQLISAYRLIIVDGPAINRYPESVLYAAQVDRVLLVVHAGVTRGPVVGQAMARLSAVDPDRIELLLNRRTFEIPQFIYRKL